MKTNNFAELVFENDLDFIVDSAELKLNEFFDKINLEVGDKYNTIPVIRTNIHGETNNFIKLVTFCDENKIIWVEFIYNAFHLSGNAREASMNSALTKINNIESLKENLLGESRYGNFKYKQLANKINGLS